MTITATRMLGSPWATSTAPRNSTIARLRRLAAIFCQRSLDSFLQDHQINWLDSGDVRECRLTSKSRSQGGQLSLSLSCNSAVALSHTGSNTRNL